jgi:hypothetical protein
MDVPFLADEQWATKGACNACAMGKGDSRAGRLNAWAVTVRLNDGTVLFWCGEASGDRWGREFQAFRFSTREEATQYAAKCETNSNALEYRAAPLPEAR